MCGTRRSLYVIMLLWLVTILTTIPFAIVSHTESAKFYTGVNVTVCRTRMNSEWQRGYAVLSVIVFFVSAFIILSVLYSIISRTITRETQELRNTSSNNHSSKATIQGRQRSAVMIGVIIVLFFICLLPFKIYSLWIIFSDTKDVESIGFEAFQILSCFVRIMFYMNSATNPIVYNIMSSKFRVAFLKVLGVSSRRASLLSPHQTTCTRATRYTMPVNSDMGSHGGK